jgi:hypothetical protein
MRTCAVALDRDYDHHLLAALPNALALFPAAALDAQLEEMAKRVCALCFTLIVPASGASASCLSGELQDRAANRTQKTAAILICLHVAPDLAARGTRRLLDTLSRAARGASEPVHHLSAPFTRPGDLGMAGMYREAVYEGDEGCFIAMTSHAPAEIPPEAAETVAQATRGMAVDAITTVAVTSDRPQRLTTRRPLPLAARPTLH